MDDGVKKLRRIGTIKRNVLNAGEMNLYSTLTVARSEFYTTGAATE